MSSRRFIGGLTAAVMAVALSVPAAAVAATGGSGGGGSGGSDTVGSDYSDLNIVLRAEDGTPVLVTFLVPAEDPADPAVAEYCVQPVSYDRVPGVDPVTNPLDGQDVSVIPLQGEWLESPPDPLPVAEIEACDPQPQYAMFVSEVELERLNLARTADSVLADKIAAVRTKLLAADTIDLDPAGRIRLDGVPIDAAPEQAGIYQSLMTTGTIPGLPADLTDPVRVGPDPAETGGNSQFDAWELAAAAIGTAASKGVPISVDSVEYYNQVIGFPPDDDYTSPWDVTFLRSEDPDNPGTSLTSGRRYVDFGDFTYHRSETFRGSVTWLDVADLEWHVDKIIDSVGFTHPEYDDVTLHGVTAFAQLADDTRAAILYLHDHEVVLPGFYMDPVGIDTSDEQLASITNPAVDLTTLPAEVFQTQPFGVTASLFNPHEPTGTLVENARVRVTVDAGDEPLTADQMSLETPDGQQVPLTAVDGDLVGWWGPEEGFPVPPGYHDSTDFVVTIADGAPTGAYRVTLDLVDVSDPATVLATDSGLVTVHANAQTVLWAGTVPSLATQDAYVTLPLRIYSPSDGTAQLSLAVTGPDDPTTPAVETIGAGDVKVYGDDGSTMVRMPLSLDGDRLVGTWDVSTVGGDTAVTWYVTFVSGALEGGYGLEVGLVGGNTLDPVVIAVTAPEEHGDGTEGGKDTVPPVVHVETDGTLGTDATFLLTTEVVEDGTTFSCRLTKDNAAGAWEDCTDGTSGHVTYSGLEPGSYVFSGRAIDAAGNVSDVQTVAWVVDEHASDTEPPVVVVQVDGGLGTSASFTLSTDPPEAGVTYQCRLTQDDVASAWEDCTSGNVGTRTYADLEPGSYVFSGRAADAAGNVSDVVTRSWVVSDEPVSPPSTSILRGPRQNAWVLADTARFRLGSDAADAQYRVRVNGGPATTCDTGRCEVQGLTSGRNRIRFAATSGGLVDTTPAVRIVWVPDGVARLARNGGWSLHRSASHLFGRYAETRHRGAVIRHRYENIRRIAIVASTGDRFGKVDVYLDGRRLTRRPIDLGARGSRPMALVPVKTFATLHSGVVKIVVASRGSLVRVDGIAAR